MSMFTAGYINLLLIFIYFFNLSCNVFVSQCFRLIAGLILNPSHKRRQTITMLCAAACWCSPQRLPRSVSNRFVCRVLLHNGHAKNTQTLIARRWTHSALTYCPCAERDLWTWIALRSRPCRGHDATFTIIIISTTIIIITAFLSYPRYVPLVSESGSK